MSRTYTVISGRLLSPRMQISGLTAQQALAWLLFDDSTYDVYDETGDNDGRQYDIDKLESIIAEESR